LEKKSLQIFYTINDISYNITREKKTIWRKVFPHFPDGHLLREIILYLSGFADRVDLIELLEKEKGYFGNMENSTYRRPQGSFSAIVSTSLAILGSKSAGRRTSPQASWACLALLSSTSSLFANA